MKPNSYQQFLDNYLAEVAAAAVQFEYVLKEQTKALQKLIEEQREARDVEGEGSETDGKDRYWELSDPTAGDGAVRVQSGAMEPSAKMGRTRAQAPSIFD